MSTPILTDHETIAPNTCELLGIVQGTAIANFSIGEAGELGILDTFRLANVFVNRLCPLTIFTYIKEPVDNP